METWTGICINMLIEIQCFFKWICLIECNWNEHAHTKRNVSRNVTWNINSKRTPSCVLKCYLYWKRKCRFAVLCKLDSTSTNMKIQKPQQCQTVEESQRIKTTRCSSGTTEYSKLLIFWTLKTWQSLTIWKVTRYVHWKICNFWELEDTLKWNTEHRKTWTYDRCESLEDLNVRQSQNLKI